MSSHRSRSASSASGTGGSGTKRPEASKTPSATSACTWVEVVQVAERLHEEDEAGAGARMRGAVRLHEQSGDDAAELSEERAAVSEERPDEPRNGEDILPVRNGRSTLASTHSP
jgi:hypothetical protein